MRCLLASLPLSIFACGGAIGPIDPASLHIEGSYDFVIGAIDVQQNQQPYQPPTPGHPAIGQHARLDIRKNGTAYEAVLTPDFSDPSAMTVTIAGGAVTLQGSTDFSSDESGYAYTDDELQAIHLAVGTDGHLSGTFTAEGQESILEGDVGWESPATASGTVGADARAPQTQATSTPSASSFLLPWDALSVRTSELVDANALQNALSLTSSKGHANMTWTLGASGVDWLGNNAVRGYRSSWSDFSGDATFAVAGGLADPSGNASSIATTTLHFVDVPVGTSFDGVTPPAMWGAAQPAASPASCGTASSCIEIGPVTGPCNAQPGGFAARLTTNGATKLSIKFRTRAASDYGPPYFPSGLAVGVATQGASAMPLSDPSLTPTFVATSDTDYPYATDWVTAVVALPVAASEVGVDFQPFGNAVNYCGPGGPAMVPITLVVDVAEITTAP